MESTENKKKRHSQVQRRLLDEGLKLMAARGVHGCTVEEITQAAGVGKGTFFNHFSSKGAFVASAVEHCLADLARRLSPLTVSTSPPETLLANLGGVYLRYFQLRPEVAALLNQAPAFEPASESGRHIKQQIDNHLNLVAKLLEPAAAARGWGQNNRELALSLLSLSCGFFWLGQGLVNPPGALLERLSKVMSRGLG